MREENERENIFQTEYSLEMHLHSNKHLTCQVIDSSFLIQTREKEKINKFNKLNMLCLCSEMLKSL